MDIPQHLRYSSDHEWISRLDDGLARVGITDYAQDALGDVVFIELPAVDDRLEAGESFGEVESTKSVSDLFAPVSGVVVEINEELADAPERINEDPYGAGWICVIRPDDGADVDALMDSSAYGELVED